MISRRDFFKGAGAVAVGTARATQKLRAALAEMR